MSGKALLLQELMRADSGILYCSCAPSFHFPLCQTAVASTPQVAELCSASRERSYLRAECVGSIGSWTSIVILLLRCFGREN